MSDLVYPAGRGITRVQGLNPLSAFSARRPGVSRAETRGIRSAHRHPDKEVDVDMARDSSASRATQDVEKRWNDPRTARSATAYAGTVIIAALVVMFGVIIWSASSGADCSDADFAVCTDPARTILLFGPVAVLLIGGLGAFVRTWRAWRDGGRWPIWHATGWVLLVLMVMYVGVAAGVAIA